eukprot:TRINITY_DN4590_c0_g1_i1.p1 TRINITY_DN4590_c0_g1~~TRINITY_DN4590_c0_g1_i1.p1  ORF type:complete len:134 (+),score=48.07 TRINITY_DN4590_c0_g1_i1:54-455(+)
MGGESDRDILSDEHAVEQAKEYLRQGNTVEFFEKIASCLLKEQPENPVEYCLEYVKSKLDNKDFAESGAKPGDTKNDDSKYMKKHNVSDFLDKWILALIAAKSGAEEEDIERGNKKRLEFHKTYLESLRQNGK